MRGGALALLFPGYCAEACASVGKYLPDFAAWRALADANTTPQHLQALQDAARARGGRAFAEGGHGDRNAPGLYASPIALERASARMR